VSRKRSFPVYRYPHRGYDAANQTLADGYLQQVVFDDGITTVALGLEDVSTYPRLIAELLRRGYSDDDVKKIAGRNVMRVLRAAEAVANGRARK